MLMRELRRFRQPRRGVAAVEMALLIPILLGLLLGCWEVGRVLHIQQMLSNAAREAGRQASAGQLSQAQAEQVARNYLDTALGSGFTASVTATVTNKSGGSDPTGATQMDKFEIEVSIPFNDVSWTVLSILPTPPDKLKGRTYWFSVKDMAYPSTINPLPGS